jgi:hypothetical protein
VPASRALTLSRVCERSRQRPRLLLVEHAFDNVLRMLTVNDVDAIRRSAAMAPLSSDEANRVLEACDQLLRERAKIAAVLADLPASWAQVRKTLNELQAIVGP